MNHIFSFILFVFSYILSRLCFQSRKRQRAPTSWCNFQSGSGMIRLLPIPRSQKSWIQIKIDVGLLNRSVPCPPVWKAPQHTVEMLKVVFTCALYRSFEDCNRSISLNIKIPLNFSIIVSSATYASETWKISGNVTEKTSISSKLSATNHGNTSRWPCNWWRYFTSLQQD